MESKVEKSAPAYISFTTFEGLLDKMREGIVPRKLDPTYLKTYAGSVQPKILHAFRYLGLTDKENVVQDALRDLVKKPEERRDLLRKMLQERYPWAMSLPLDATEQDLLDSFKTGSGIEGETRRKAVTFFLSAAEKAQVELSPLFKKTRGRPTGATTTRRPAAKRTTKKSPEAPKGGDDEQTLPSVASTKEEMTASYFAMLLDKAKSGQKVDPELANRMERVLGFSAGAEATTRPASRKKPAVEPSASPDSGAPAATEESS